MKKTNEYFLLYRTGSIHPEIVCTTVDPQDACLLRSLYKWIGCSDIEIVRPTLSTSKDVRDLLMVVDGEGLMRSREQNTVASLLYAGRIVGDVIIGQMVLRDEEPDIGGWATIEEAQAAATPVFREVQHVMYMQPWRKGGYQMTKESKLRESIQMLGEMRSHLIPCNYGGDDSTIIRGVEVESADFVLTTAIKILSDALWERRNLE